MRPALAALLLCSALPAALAGPAEKPTSAPAPAVARSPAAVPRPGWRDMLRTYEKFRDTNTDCTGKFPGFDPEMARLGEAFALTAYPNNNDLGRKNFRRLALRLNLSTPVGSTRFKIFTPNKEPWPGYKGRVDSSGLFHFVFYTGTLPMPIFDHPIVRVVLRSSVSHSRVQPAAEVASRVLRAGNYDLSVVEHDPAVRARLIGEIRKAYDAEHPEEKMSDDEADCLGKCLVFMT